MNDVYAWFEWLNTSYGVNLSVFYDPYDRVRFARGLWTTVWLSLVSIGFSVLIGIIGAWAQGARSRVLRTIVRAYIQFFRNTPPLIQLYFFYFAVGSYVPLVATDTGQLAPAVGSLFWAVVSLSFFAGAFNVEIFRSGIEAVPHSMIETVESLGYTRSQAYRHVIFPIAFRFCLPALTNNLVNLVKTTTLTYAIAVPELIYVSAQIWSDALNVREMMNLLLVIYLTLVGILVFVMRRWERALRMPGFGH
jgi:polar amino acid transport system permease protein